MTVIHTPMCILKELEIVPKNMITNICTISSIANIIIQTFDHKNHQIHTDHMYSFSLIKDRGLFFLNQLCSLKEINSLKKNNKRQSRDILKEFI